MVLKLLRRATGSWTIERKSILFFGTTLLLCVSITSYIVHYCADDAQLQNTRKTAKEYALLQVYNRHVWEAEKDPLSPVKSIDDPAVFATRNRRVYEELMRKPRNTSQLLSLEVATTHAFLSESLDVSIPPEERALLQELESEFRAELPFEVKTSDTPSPADASTTSGSAVENPMLPTTQDDVKVFRELRTADGSYVYYLPVLFHESCLSCHRRLSTAVTDMPFLAMRVTLPVEETQGSSALLTAVLISVAMITLSVALLSLHLILRKLVVRPLHHLRTVSEDIIRGKMDQRAEIDTDDEFRELADAFNRMLRYLTESQQQLQSLNQTLDSKVDELAQANLHLYEANRLKSDFLANMSHELRTPLNSIIGFSDVLQDISSLTDKQRRYAANIQKSGRMLLEMINDILDLAKIEAGKLQVKPLLFDINHVLQAQCDMMRSLSEEKNIDVQLNHDTLLQLVFQDAPKIQQIVNNLLSNAIKFTPEGGLITITTGTQGTDYFHITIEDTGVGIPENDFEIIFEKFRQSNAILQGGDNLTRQYSGTGLGLSIVKELCKLLGGEVALTSHVGKGSTFRVALPRHYHNKTLGEPASESLTTA